MRACVGSGGAAICGLWSDDVSVSVVLGIPSGLASDEGISYDGTYRVSWDSLAGHSYTISYELQENPSGGAWPLSNVNVYAGTALFNDMQKMITSSASYSYRLRACSANVGCGPYSTQDVPSLSLTVAMALLSAPALALGDDPDAGSAAAEDPSYDGSFTLEWTTVTGAAAYELEQSSDGGSNWAAISGVGNVSSYGLGSPTAISVGGYDYRVLACANAGCTVKGPASAEVSLTVYDFSSPPNLSASDTVSTDGSYSISWGSLGGAASYELREDSSAGPTTVYTGSNRSYALSSKQLGVYEYSVRACGERETCTAWSGRPLAVSVGTGCALPAEDSGFNGGSGTSTDPYLICNYTQLGLMRSGLGASYELGQDIDAVASWEEGDAGCNAYDGSTVPVNDACSGWVPVGNNGSRFTGSLDGGGYVISNLYVWLFSFGREYGALFGYAAQGAVIRNIGLTALSITSISYSNSPSVFAYAGGLAAYNSGTITNSYAAGSVSSRGYSAVISYGGGLVGYNAQDGTIRNSYALSSVLSKSDGSSYAGGLAAYNSGKIYDSYAALGPVSNGAGSSASPTIGGLAGYNSGTITNSYAAAPLSLGSGSTSPTLGGLVGNNSGTISGINYFVDSSGSNGIGTGGACGSTVCIQQSVTQLRARDMGAAGGWNSNNWLFAAVTELPRLKYVNKPAGACGAAEGPACGSEIAGQDFGLITMETWMIGSWSACSAAACGASGTRSRTLSCSYDSCGAEQPGSSESCSARACYSCSSKTESSCELSSTADGGSGGSCSNGHIGACGYSCDDGAWTKSFNSCALPAGCAGSSMSNCELNSAAHTASSGSCSSGYTGTCSYSCSNASWSKNSNDCKPSSGLLSAGNYHTCAVKSGALYCWGNNGNGRLGDGMTTPRAMPVPVSTMASGVSSVASGNSHTCAVKSGALYCWGYNYYGQLGDGTTTGSNTPAAVSTMASGVSSVASGNSHTCAVKSGALYCWGYNYYGQLGDGTSGRNTNRNTPVAVWTMASGVSSVSAGNYHTCAIKGGALYCWGYNGNGQLGDGTTTNSNTPAAVWTMASGVSSVASGYSHTCAIKDAALYCWGNNGQRQLGDGTRTRRVLPVAVSAMDSGVSSVSGGYSHTCAIKDAALYCWGYNG